jgi:hypothetical protein
MADHVPLDYGIYYHIYNRGINKEHIFIEESNYQYFLALIKKHILGIADLYAYCLLKNHFHLLVRINSENQIAKKLSLHWANEGLPRPSQKFSNLFNAYTKAFNKRYNRTGGLFQRPFRRVRISTNRQLSHLVVYIHQNPEKHGLADDFRNWPYSSYNGFFQEEIILTKKEEVIEWFGTISEFEKAHEMDAFKEKDLE